jgi:Sensors of blue-light using FAD
MPLSEIIHRDYDGLKPAAETLCEYCYVAVVGAELFQRHSRKAYKTTLRKVHATNKLTGRMVWSSGYVLHYLEGTYSALEERFDLLRQDPIHQEVCQILLQPLYSRRFEDWTLYSVDMEDSNHATQRLKAVLDLCKYKRPDNGLSVLEIFLNPG